MPVSCKTAYFVVCDDCGKQGPLASCLQGASDEVIELGWKVTGCYLCPECIDKRAGISRDGYFV